LQISRSALTLQILRSDSICYRAISSAVKPRITLHHPASYLSRCLPLQTLIKSRDRPPETKAVYTRSTSAWIQEQLSGPTSSAQALVESTPAKERVADSRYRQLDEKVDGIHQQLSTQLSEMQQLLKGLAAAAAPSKGEQRPASQELRDSSPEAEASEDDDTSRRIREIDEDELNLWTDDGQEQLTQ